MLTNHKRDIISTPPSHYQSSPPPYTNSSSNTIDTAPEFQVYASGTFNKVLTITLPDKDKNKPAYTATTQTLSSPNFTIQKADGSVVAQATYAKLGSGIETTISLPSGTQTIKMKKDSYLHRTRTFTLFDKTWSLKQTNQGTSHTLGKDYKLVNVADVEHPYVMFRTNHGMSKWGHFEFLRGRLSQEQVDVVVAVVLICIDKIRRETKNNGARAGGISAGVSAGAG